MPKAPKVGTWNWGPHTHTGQYTSTVNLNPDGPNMGAGSTYPNASRWGNPPSQSSPDGPGCFLKGTLITMADGSTKPVEQVDLKDEVAVGGYVFATGKFLINNLHDYKGIKVSGSHMVKEDNEWKYVHDSKHSKALGPGDHVVYVFGCENKRILINNTLFTDYFDGFEQEGLKKLGEKYFNDHMEHAELLEKEIVDVLNKK